MSPTERWEIQGKFDDECGVEIIVQGDGDFVCDVEPLLDEWDAEQIARVRLIGAAPEMLEALQNMTAMAHAFAGDDPKALALVGKATEIICKAKGELR
jgi:hypothetical protein